MTRRQQRPPTKPGLYPDLSFELYKQIDAHSSSELRTMGSGPRHCWHRRRVGKVATQAMLDGTLAHIQILDPQAYLDRVVEWTEAVYKPRPALKWAKIDNGHYATLCGRYHLWSVEGGDWRPVCDDAVLDAPGSVTAGKAACKEHYEKHTPRQPKLDDDSNPKLAPRNPASATYQAFLRNNPGRTVVVAEDIAKAKRVQLAVRDNPDARALLSSLWRTEYSIVWRHADTGVLCKARLDGLTDPHRRLVTIVDLKLCRSITEAAFNRAAADAEHHAQLEWYGQGLRAHFPDIELRYAILAVESGSSHDSTVFDIDPEDDKGGPIIAAGHDLNEERLQEILRCEDEYPDEPWPGRCPRTQLDFATYAPRALPDCDNGYGLDLSGVERHHGEED